MKISTKFLTGSAVSVGLIVAILVGNTIVVQQIKQNIVDKSEETTEIIKLILESDSALKSEIIALKDIALFKIDNPDRKKFEEKFAECLNKLKEKMPNAPEIAVINRRHQFLDKLATHLTQANSSSTYLEDAQQYFRAINSFNRDIELFLYELIDRAYQQRNLQTQDLENLNQVQRIISVVLVAVIIMLFLTKYQIIWLPIIKSLQDLQLGTAAIANGNFDYRLEMQTGDEIEEVAKSFNDMAFKLAQSRETLVKNNELTNINQRLEIEINERKQAELELQKALRELQNTQAQLIQTEKMSSLGQLVAGIAHEINNPVNFIYGNLSHADEYIANLIELVHLYQLEFPQPGELIEDKIAEIDLDFLRTDLQKILSSMKMGSQRIKDIVLSLRNFSRLDEADMKVVDIHEGIESTLLILQNRFKRSLPHPNIEVIKEYGNLPLVECHAGQLNQVFLNIINNAIDALDDFLVKRDKLFTPQIIIRTQLLDTEKVVITIADNGGGMTEEVKQKLFDPFFTTKPVGQGTGLGLSISYQIIVKKHSGILQCESKLGQGTEFRIEIPLRQL